MPRYIVERTIGQLSRQDLEAAALRSKAAIGNVPGVIWIKSYVSDIDGKMYCEYEAPDPEAIREHARLAGLAVDHIAEVSLEISPAMFH